MPPGTSPALPERIYLTGFMGSGKSTLGPRLAESLGYGFTDLDALIEERAGRPVPVLFAEEGEAAFRRLETEALREAAGRERVVVALGGGALTIPENLELARSTGLVVYLRVPVEGLVRRLMKVRTGRPLLMGSEGRPLPEADLRRKVEWMVGAREPFYSQAHITVEMGGLGEEASLTALLEAARSVGAASPESTL